MIQQQTTIPETARSAWPDAVAFREAIQMPSIALADPELKGAAVVCDRLGMPVTHTGRFAVVFRLRCGQTEWALRCFTQGADAAERPLRYTAIAAHVGDLPGCFVPFRYREQGIRVAGRWYPVVAMRWAEGETLGRWVERRRNDPRALRRLAAVLGELLARLEAGGIAHGDWQHDNLLVSPGGERVTLVDYDGMFVPELAGRLCPERGHPNYQHPARTAHHYGVGLDRFACLVLQTGLLALAREPSLWERFNDGESILFKRADIENTKRSPVFRAVRAVAGADAILTECLDRLEAACASGLEEIRIPEGPVLTPPKAAAAETLDPKKWWLTPETRTQTATRAPSPGPAGVSVEGRYLTRLAAQEIAWAEMKNLWWGRLGYFLTLPACVLTVPALFLDYIDFFFPWWVFLNFTKWGYGAWPRKKLFDELCAEITRVEKLIAERQERIAKGRAAQGPPAGGNPVQDFVLSRLKQTSISRVLTVPGISVTTLRHLRAAHIDTAADLRPRAHVPGVPAHELTALQNWRSRLETEAADEYRRRGFPPAHAPAGAARQTPADVERLENEVAGLEQELDKLRDEKASFPGASGKAYLRKLLGMRGTEPGD